MEQEYDFSEGVRGRFYNKDATFHLPVYLDTEVESFFTKLAEKQDIDLNQMINSLLARDKDIIELANIKD